jgi:hypothetical protein
LLLRDLALGDLARQLLQQGRPARRSGTDPSLPTRSTLPAPLPKSSLSLRVVGG